MVTNGRKRNLFRWVMSSHLVIIFTLLIVITPASAAVVFAATLSGTNGDDALRGSNSADVMYGYPGNDVIFGYGGNDKLYGGNGDDVISGGDGNDNIYGWHGGNILLGGLGDDTIYATGTNSPEDLVNYIFGEDGDDHILRMAGPSIIHGGDGNDNITSGADDTITPATVYGESGNDEIYMYNDDSAFGGDGDDYLWGTYNSHLNGDVGDDTLVAHSPDIMSLTGGPGADHFDCQGSEDVRLTDFNTDEGDTQTDCPSVAGSLS